jgi:Ca2+-binding RTX toxin-like protein
MTGSVAGRFEVYSDVDWYRVRFEAGKAYTLFSGTGGSSDATLTLMLPDGEPYYLPTRQFMAPVTGDYWVSATGHGVQSYSITAQEVVVNDVHPANVSTDLSLTVDSTVSTPYVAGNVGDDWYAMDLVAGQSYVLSTSYPGYRPYVFQPDGTFYDSSTNVGSSLHFTANETGRFYAGVSLLISGYGYSVSLRAVADDYGTTSEWAGSLTVGGSTSGLWEVGGDTDWHAITLNAGERYHFSINPSESIGSLSLIDADGNHLALTDPVNGGVDVQIDASGVYYVAVSGGGASYTLSASIVPPFEPEAYRDMVIGETVSDSLQSADERDWFAVTLKGGEAYNFTLGSMNASTAMRLVDSHGETVVGGGATMDVSIVKDGTYYVETWNWNGASSYSLTSTTLSLVGDLAADSTTTGRLVVGSITSGTFETNNDVDWFAVDLVAGKSYALEGDFFGTIAVKTAGGATLMEGKQHFSPKMSGTYYVALTGDGGDYNFGIVEMVGDVGETMQSTGVIRQSMSGTAGDDLFTSTEDHDAFYGQAGNDQFNAGAGYDLFVGGAGTDVASFTTFTSGVHVDLGAGGLIENGAVRVRLSQVEVVQGTNFDDHLTGSGGDDQLYGLDGDDLLEGGAGNDILIGGRGGDQMIGGAGDDLYVVDDIRDTVSEDADAGIDTVQSSVSFVLGDNVENLALGGTAALTGTGNALNNVMTGNSGVSTLLGGDGDDHLSSGVNGRGILVGGAGSDVLIGSAGNDSLNSGLSGVRDMGTEKDVLIAGAGDDGASAGYGDDVDGGEGYDSLSYSFGGASAGIDIRSSDLLGAGPHVIGGGTVQNFERLSGLRGSEFDDYINYDTFYISQLVIEAGAGNDTVIITGDAPVKMLGGEGDDRLVIGYQPGNAFDGGAGSDTIDFSLYGEKVTVALGLNGANGNGGPYLTQLLNVENVIGSSYADGIVGNELANDLRGGDGDDTILGQDGADILYGEAGNDVLGGGAGIDTLYGGTGNDRLDGGAGADRLVGGVGDDIYIVDTAGDVIVELAGEGNDTVVASGSYTLSDHVETLKLSGTVGAADMRGNGQDNLITAEGASGSSALGIRLFGLGGNDMLLGSVAGDVLDGGTGNDVMKGGLGSDLYYVDSVGDQIVEGLNAGVDHVASSISYTLGANVEGLTLTGSANLNGIGNALSNAIFGNDGNNYLSGMGGRDTLYGYGGNDVLVPGDGNNVVDGGVGYDLLLLTGAKGSYSYLSANGSIYLVGEEGATKMTGVEAVRFADGTVATGDLASTLTAFDGLRYVAGYSDLMAVFGTNAAAGVSHYVSSGFAEGRDAKSFDPLDYIAGYSDLASAFGTDAQAATRHYITTGAREGRNDDRFDALDYLASYADLSATLGADEEAGARHYLTVGKAQGRSDDGFDGLQYAAGYADLAALFGSNDDAAARHYIQYGRAEGRVADKFDGLRYIASNADLIVAIGDNDDAAAKHYLDHGFAEHRSTTSFDALKYAAANPDLAAAFGSDVEALTEHYIDFGYYEHRAIAPAAAMVEVIG